MNLKYFAKRLPKPIKKPLMYIYGFIPTKIRYGKVFWQTYNFLQESQWWSKEKLEEYQMQRLEKLLKHAYENVPYYRKMFDERGLKPEDIQDLDDLRKLPYLTKDIFKSHFNEIAAKNIKLKNLPISHTSGTTGKPLQFYTDYYAHQKELAFIYHQWSRFGVKPATPMIQIRGAIINKNKPSEYNPIFKILRLSPKIDNKETVYYYIKKIQDFGAQYFHGYPSSIATFAMMIKQYKIGIPFKLKAALFASENVYKWQREITKEIFNCRVFSHYGLAEQAVLAGECERTSHYHCLPQYGITEIDADTNEIIGTSFLNYVNPFIRYRTTDIAAAPILSYCSECGRKYYPILPSVDGRLEDFIITPKGTLISPAVITHPFKDFKTIKNTQIVQESINYIKLIIVPWNNCNPNMLEDELQQLCEGLQNIIGPEMKIETEIVQSIPLSKAGKFKWIISNISKGFLENGVRQT